MSEQKDPTADYKTVKVDVQGSEAITAGIKAGNILTRESVVLVRELKTKLLFEDRIPVNLAGAAALLGGSVESFAGKGVDQVPALNDKKEPIVEDGLPVFKRGESVVGLFYYGYNLTVRNYVRTKFMNETAAPEKKDEQRVKMLMAAGYSKEDAETIIKNAPSRLQDAPADAPSA